MPEEVMENTLRLAFSTNEGKNVVVPIHHVHIDLTVESVQHLMDTFIECQPFAKYELKDKIGAEKVYTTKSEVF